MTLPFWNRRVALWAGGGALVVALGLAAVFWWPFSRADKEPFYGPHQAGITTAGQKFAFVTAFDLTARSADDVRGLLKTWTRASAALTQGLPVEASGPSSVPPADTGEVLGYKPARLTVTFGAGLSLFDGRFGLADQKPSALTPIPPFPGDHLNPDWSDGDLVVQVCADDVQTAYHAIHTLTRLAKGVAVARWSQAGFQPGLEVNASGPGRNLQGFIDGTVNPDVHDPATMDQVVWVTSGPGWLHGGSFLVVRRIRMFVETWDRSSLQDQERTIGRDKANGKELPTLAEDSHVRLARGTGVEKILRRPFSYVNGLDGRTGQWDSGLLFLAWMKDPGRQYVPMQARLASNDALNEYIRPVGSAIFAVFPGTKPGDYVGSGLFPDQPLAARIEGLQAQLGALYPALAVADWPKLRAGAAAVTEAWVAERDLAGTHRDAIDVLKNAWVASLQPESPDPSAVRSTQAALIKALSSWETQLKPGAPGSLASLEGLKHSLAQATQAWKAGDVTGARTAFGQFQTGWTSQEALVRSLDTRVYSEVEVQTGTARRALEADRPGPQAAAALDDLTRLLASLQAPRAFGPWDVGVLLLREGLEALLVLAALLAFLHRTNQKHRRPWVWSGALLGLAASLGVAVLVSVVLTGWMASSTPELVEGVAGLAAVALMLTVGAWLHGKAAIKNWTVWFQQKMSQAGNRAWALGLLAFLAVLREGAETVVFLWGMAGALPLTDLLLGIGGGLAVLAVLGVVMIGFSKRLPLRVFFPVATALIYFLAVKILGQSLGSLQTSGWFGATPLGFGQPLDWLGFLPTWETAVPQVVLTLVLAGALALSLIKAQPGPSRPS